MSNSIGKTETMVIGRSLKSINITINNSPLQQEKEFKYACLGNVFSDDG